MKKLSLNLLAAGHLLERLNKPVAPTLQELVDCSGFSYPTVRLWVKLLHERPDGKNLIFISSWNRHGKGFNARYSWGPGKQDVSKPEPKSADQSRKDYEERRKIKQGPPVVRKAALYRARSKLRTQEAKQRQRDPITGQWLSKSV